MTPAPEIPGVATVSDTPEVELRPVETRKELEACVELQRDTWGRDFTDIVPVSMMGIAVRMGGLCLGAFGPGGQLLGFVFGVTGLREGRLAHWSHMLAVRTDARNGGVGRKLKFAQREAAAAMGVEEVLWTFDPLVGRNAHFNLNQLGASVTEYVPDMYGVTNSILHRLGTDRFIARWDLDEDHESVVRRRAGVVAPAGAEMTSRPVVGMPGEDCVSSAGADVVEVLVPRDIRAMTERCLDEAWTWRHANRRAFMGLQREGCEVLGFAVGREFGRYVVRRGRGGPCGPV